MAYLSILFQYLFFITILILSLSLECSATDLTAVNFTQSVAFDLNTTLLGVPCWYPVSVNLPTISLDLNQHSLQQGDYGRLPRMLFYCVVVFALLASHLEWLVIGALAAAFTYSGSAAIHGCLLTWRGPASGDLDVYALIAILSTSCLVIVPLINWSTTLRNLGSRDDQESGARTIIIYWGALVAVGLLSTLTVLWSSAYYVWNFSTLNPITCHPPGSRIIYDAGQKPMWCRFIIGIEWVQENGCIDPCQQSSFAFPQAIFRSKTDLQLLSRAQLEATMAVIDPFPENSFFERYLYFGTILGLFIIVQGVWAVCFGRRNPRQARNTIYTLLVGLHLGSFPRLLRMNHKASGRWHKRVARYVATIAYLWAVLASILSVLLFLANIVTMEVLLAYYPQSESAAHIGAWSYWASTGLVILAAFIGRFHESVVQRIFAILRQIYNECSDLWADGGFHGTLSKKGNGSGHLIQHSPKGPLQSKGKRNNGTNMSYLIQYCLQWMLGVRCNMVDEWLSLKDFWKHPDDAVGLSSNASVEIF